MYVYIYFSCQVLCLTWFIIYKYAYIHINTSMRMLLSVFFFSDIDRTFLWQNGREFLIQANTQKRQKLRGDDDSTVFEHVEVGSRLMSYNGWNIVVVERGSLPIVALGFFLPSFGFSFLGVFAG